MTINSNNQGRAFEYITLITLKEEISKVRDVVIKEDSSFFATKRAWNQIDSTLQSDLKKASKAPIDIIFESEPMICEDSDDVLELLIQPDSQGEKGDVRDILLVRRGISWEVGLSLKHNHSAVKHSRLAKDLDFGEKWFGIPCSEQYWKDIGPIFKYLEEEKSKRLKWRDLPDKENDVYVPLLNAFKDEVIRSSNSNPEVPRRMIEYLVGDYDFYKVTSWDRKKITEISTYNLKGTLNQSNNNHIKNPIPIVNLPTKIINIDFKAGKKNTIEMFMDEGWQFSFRIHNASSKVETSLKFDIKPIKRPDTIVQINCKWNE